MIRRKEQMQTVQKPNLRGGEGVIHAYQLLEPSELSGKGQLFSILTIDPGCSIGTHAHGPDAEIFYLLEGQLEVVDNGTDTQLFPGDAMFTGNGESHSIRNAQSQPAKLLAVVIC